MFRRAIGISESVVTGKAGEWKPPHEWKENWPNHNQRLARIHWNPFANVTIYTEVGALRSHKIGIEVLDFISEVWPYMSKTYGNFGPNPYLNLVIHQYVGYKFVYHGLSLEATDKSNPNILDIGNAQYDWSLFSTQNSYRDNLLRLLAYFVEYSAKDRLSTPSYAIWKESEPKHTAVSAWNYIFTYDVYMGLNMTSEALRFKLEESKKSENNPRLHTYWFRDWFLPIYTNHGGSKVLNGYFQLLHDHLPYEGNRYTYTLDMGEFVHFWSGAAGVDLTEIANRTFGWTKAYQELLIGAQRNFPDVTTLYNKVLPTNDTATEKPDHSGTLETVTMAAGIGGALCLLILLALLALGIFYKRKPKVVFLQPETAIRSLTHDEVKNFFDGDPNENSVETQALVQSKPFIKDFEIPRNRLTLDPSKVLGTGLFGSVVHGKVFLGENDRPLAVAMKTVKPNADVLYFKAFLSEVKIMAYLGRHPNIVELHATCTTNIQNREIFIALEFCSLGNLLDYLKKNREHFSSTAKNPCLNSIAIRTDISTLDLLKWSQDIANAMVYLTQKKVIHGDLAARNILLTDKRVAKISDFGLSRQFLNYANYMKTSKLPVPWRWLAIEALKEMTFSTASDVWAFGVTIWEIFSLAEVPYGAWTYDLFFVDRLVSGDRLLKPTHANEQVYDLMRSCWSEKPQDRPLFIEIHSKLEDFILKFPKIPNQLGTKRNLPPALPPKPLGKFKVECETKF